MPDAGRNTPARSDSWSPPPPLAHLMLAPMRFRLARFGEAAAAAVAERVTSRASQRDGSVSDGVANVQTHCAQMAGQGRARRMLTC